MRTARRAHRVKAVVRKPETIRLKAALAVRIRTAPMTSKKIAGANLPDRKAKAKRLFLGFRK